MTLTSVLSGTPIKELLRAINSDKEYLFFDISVFNVGAQINIKCTNIYKEINPNTWNGYDFIIENSDTTKYYIAEVLKERLTEIKEKDIKKALKAIDYWGEDEITEDDLKEYSNGIY